MCEPQKTIPLEKHTLSWWTLQVINPHGGDRLLTRMDADALYEAIMSGELPRLPCSPLPLSGHKVCGHPQII